MKQEIENYNLLFKNSLIGRWHEFSGSFEIVNSKIVEIHEDGTGRIIIKSAFSGTSIEKFNWEQISEYKIAITYYVLLTEENVSLDSEMTDNNNESFTEIFNYRFENKTSDLSNEITLVSVEDNSKSFNFIGSLYYLGKVASKSNQSINIVNGIIPKFDKYSKEAKIFSLNNRFSICLNTFYPELEQMYFDFDLFEKIFNFILRKIEYSEIEVYLVNNYRISRSIQNCLNLIELYEVTNGNEPIERIKIINNGEVVLYIETEFYTNSGGPKIYHDNYNFAFYFNNLDAIDILNNLVKECNFQKIKIGKYIKNYNELLQVKEPIYKQIINWFLN